MHYSINISENTKVSEVIDLNPLTLLMLEHFDIPLGFKDKTVAEIASENSIDLNFFISIINLYNNTLPERTAIDSLIDITPILNFLRKSHEHYLIEKFPLLTMYLSEISKLNRHPEIEMLIRFFDNYLDEVAEHLRYEDEIVFPYIMNLIKLDHSGDIIEPDLRFSISEYRSHHDNIEEKLNDLKNLLIRHLPSQNDTIPRRKLLLALNELEADLHVHSLTEDTILIPMVERLELSIRTKK